MNKLISIIVPVYNAEDFLPKCIDSIMDQSVRDWEILIVDDGSKGNVKELYRSLWGNNPRIKLISHDRNRGLFHARITGMEHAEGEWIAFVDADDSISPDRFRLMIEEGRRQDADMVWGDCVLLTGGGKMRRFNSMLEHQNRPIESPELQKLFFQQSGSDYEWHTVWGKIYRKDLAEKMLPLMKKQTRYLVMCEDVAVSVCAFTAASKLAFVHGAPYYYNKLNEGASTCVRSFASIEKTLDSIETAFSFSNMIVRQYDPGFRGSVSFWKERILGYWYNNVMNAADSLKAEEKQLLVDRIKKLCAPLPVDELRTRLVSDWANEKMQSLSGPDLDEIRQTIAAPRVKIVSFDIFDTLVVRPFYWPNDLFIFLGNDFLKKFKLSRTFMFKEMRIQAEKMARTRHPKGEPCLDEIYRQFQLMTGFSDEQIAYCKEREYALELQYCRPRKSAHDLYEYALACGKVVIATSDMYLPEAFLRKMLHNCGYHDLTSVSVSCTNGFSKYNGDAYRKMLEFYHLAPDEIVHIGDNYHPDVEVPRELGIRAFHFRRPVDIFEDQFRYLFCPFGNQNSWALFAFLGMRCMLAEAACKLYDNPSLNLIPPGMTFGGSLPVVGYFGLGMHLLALAQWIGETVKKQHISGLHFLYRDGYLPQEAYNILYGDSNEKVPSDTWYLNRKIANQLLLKEKDDLLALLTGQTSIRISLDNIVHICQGVIPQSMIDLFVRHFSKKIAPDQEFSEEQKVHLIRFLRHFYSSVHPYFEKYNRQVSDGLKKKLFGSNDATFDIGYSCRSESFLKRYGIDLSALYLHINQDIALERTKAFSIRIFTFYDFLPLNTGVVREICFSKAGPYCEGFRFDKGDLVPVFAEKSDYNEDVQTIIHFIQREALEFVRDWKKVFAGRMEELTYRYTDASRFFEQFLHLATPGDMDIMRAFPFEDNFGADTTESVADFWWKINAPYHTQFNPNGELTRLQHELTDTRNHGEWLQNELTNARNHGEWLQHELTDARNRSEWLQNERDSWRQAHDAMEHSVSFFIGRMITWPLRMTRNCVRCWRQNGFVYTCGRIPVKIRNLANRLKK